MLQNKSIFYLFVTLLMSISTTGAQAQSNTSTPYSRYGYGILDNQAIGASRALSGVGYALQSGKQINPKNPASYAAIDTLTFLFDVGVSVTSNRMTENSISERRAKWSFDYVALQIPLARWLAASAGMMPYSTVGYNYMGEIENGSVRQEGTGSINQVYLGLGAHIFKGFTIGVNFKYLFGEIENNSVSASNIDATNATMFSNIMDISDYRIEVGAQYKLNINEKNRLSIGAVFTPGKKLLGNNYISGGNYNTSSGNTTVFENDTLTMKNGYSLPDTYGAGICYVFDERLTVGADFSYQAWSRAKFDGKSDYFNDYLNIAIGAEFLPRIYSNNFMQSVRYRAGVNVGRSYARIKSKTSYNDLWEAGFTIGAGIPMKKNKSIVNISFGYQNRRTTPTSLVTENEFKVSLGLTFNEMWFYKSRLH